VSNALPYLFGLVVLVVLLGRNEFDKWRRQK
jgi:hypothetical protein